MAVLSELEIDRVVFEEKTISLEGAYRRVEEKVRASLIENPRIPHDDFDMVIKGGDGKTRYHNHGALVNFRVPPGCVQVTEDQVLKVGVTFSTETNPFVTFFVAREDTSSSKPMFVTSSFLGLRGKDCITPLFPTT